MRDVKDKSSAIYQRMTWDALRKSMNAAINKVNAANIKNILINYMIKKYICKKNRTYNNILQIVNIYFK
jgi:hypothetical protein